jgi:hypothetical protein
MPDNQERVFDRIRVGMSVRDISDRRVGMVAAVEGTIVRVDCANGSAWLSADVIFTVDQEVVTLLCSKTGLQRYVVHPPLAS